MNPILCIDTALETATICLSDGGMLIDADHNTEMKDHASWLHPAVNRLLDNNGIGLNDIKAIAVSIGPGSYTGLRVGLAAAKGFCYALKIPLICIGTLEIMANAVKEEAIDLICPMIDARRMEVYTAVYNKDLIEKISPHAMILQEDSLGTLLTNHHILFCGNGMHKFRPVLKNRNIAFTELTNMALSISTLADKYLQNKKITDIAYCEPLYLKDFHSTTTRP
jgi:tRNA threonylcarbamoyladenosine biosynthesis protein TsaB